VCLVLVVKVALLVTIIVFSLFGCADEYDLDDLEKLKKVASTAILESALSESEDFMSTFSGWAKRNHSNGQLESLTMYKDGKWDGPCVFWFENGLKMHQGNYLKGREHGEWRFWRMDGTNSQVQTFDNGEKDGPYVWWHPNGKKGVEGTFKMGTRDGLWIFYNEQGEQNKFISYDMGTELL